MPAAVVDLTIEQGTTWNQRFTWTNPDATPISLVGYTARMQIRKPLSASVVLVELTTENNRIELGGAAGTIDLTIDAVTTAALQWTGEAAYDLELVQGSVVRRLVQGVVALSPEVTRG